MGVEDEVEALRWEVRELRKEVARLRAAQEEARVDAHPAYQQLWSNGEVWPPRRR